MTDYLETDQVKRIGVVPFIDMDSLRTYQRKDETSSQVVFSGGAADSLVTIYTVTAGKTLHLTYLWVGVFSDVAGWTYAQPQYTNASDTLQHYFGTLYVFEYTHRDNTWVFNQPIEIPTGYKIKLFTNNALTTGNIFGLGYEI